MIYCFDIDGTICTNTGGNYQNAKPFHNRISQINHLYNNGHTIKLFTARGSTTGKDWTELTEYQMKAWGLNYHELIFGKPEADIFVDDKAKSDYHYFIPKNTILGRHWTALEKTFDDKFMKKLVSFSRIIYEKLSRGGKVITAGNGGSFSDAQHFSAELTGRFIIERRPLSSIVLGSNNSSLSAIANDYSYDKAFSRELQAVASNEDILICFSTSGTSSNIVELAKSANKIGIPCYLFSSQRVPQSSLCNWSDSFLVSSDFTPSIQELHIMMIHIICNEIDKYAK